jgi:hypothetical protein
LILVQSTGTEKVFNPYYYYYFSNGHIYADRKKEMREMCVLVGKRNKRGMRKILKKEKLIESLCIG